MILPRVWPLDSTSQLYGYNSEYTDLLNCNSEKIFLVNINSPTGLGLAAVRFSLQQHGEREIQKLNQYDTVWI